MQLMPLPLTRTLPLRWLAGSAAAAWAAAGAEERWQETPTRAVHAPSVVLCFRFPPEVNSKKLALPLTGKAQTCGP